MHRRRSSVYSFSTPAALCRLQQEFDFHRFERKNDAPVILAVEDADVY